MATKSPSIKNTAGRNRKIAKFTLAGVAIVGIGAGLTSAAWTDNVWFGATAEAGNIDLEGSITGAPGSWLDSDDSGAITLNVPSSEFAGLTPNDTVSVTLHLRNNGEGEFQLQTPDVTTVDDTLHTLFTTPDLLGDFAEASAVGYTEVDGTNDGLIQPTDEATFQLTITTPDWDGTTGMDLAGVVQVQIEAIA